MKASFRGFLWQNMFGAAILFDMRHSTRRLTQWSHTSPSVTSRHVHDKKPTTLSNTRDPNYLQFGVFTHELKQGKLHSFQILNQGSFRYIPNSNPNYG